MEDIEKYPDKAISTDCCRICYQEESDRSRLISPCLCSGSIRFVHASCLRQWRIATLNPEYVHRCNACKFSYIVNDSSGKSKFGGFIGMCTSIILVLALLFLVGFIVMWSFCFMVFFRSNFNLNGELLNSSWDSFSVSRVFGNGYVALGLIGLGPVSPAVFILFPEFSKVLSGFYLSNLTVPQAEQSDHSLTSINSIYDLGLAAMLLGFGILHIILLIWLKVSKVGKVMQMIRCDFPDPKKGRIDSIPIYDVLDIDSVAKKTQYRK